MKKLLFLIFLLLIGAGVLYKMDIKPEAKEVIKQVETDSNASK